jgi:hypothetical protein
MAAFSGVGQGLRWEQRERVCGGFFLLLLRQDINNHRMARRTA